MRAPKSVRAALTRAAAVAILCGPGLAPAGAQDEAGSVPQHRLDEARAKAAGLARRDRAGGPAIADQPNLIFDVTFYDLALAFDPPTARIDGDARLVARMGATPHSSVLIDLDAPMQVDSVQVDGAPAVFQHVGDDLVVELGRTYVAGEPFAVRVLYGGTPDASSALHFETRNGLPLVWTLSEPYGSRTWWPCQDKPGDKADSLHLDLSVPTGMTAVGNGTLAGTTTAGGRTTFHWRERYPITPYLVSIAAHAYVQQNTTYTPFVGPPMPVTLWAFPDQAGLATPFLTSTVQMLQCYAGRFGDYPFRTEKYAIAQFSWGGGMEHQTATSQCCWSNSLTAHELAHQWFGDAVTCETFADIWLNEGFATYSEALWDEARFGAAAYRASILANRWFGNGTIRVPAEDLDDFARIFDGNLSYNKASWILHMLRGVLGDGPFFDVLRAYVADARFAYGTATTDDFRSVAEAVSGRDLRRFFAEWIDRPYFPTYVYGYRATPDGGGWSVDLSIEQLQSHGLYAMPIQVRVDTEAGSELFVVEDSLQQQSFQLQVASPPQAVVLDPDRWIHCTTEAELAAPSFWRGVLLVNGVSWATGTALTSAYADSCFTAGYPFQFWDVQPQPGSGYVPQLPAPLGHGTPPAEVLQEYSTVVWVGDLEVDAWSTAPLLAYLRAGGNVLLLSRRGQEFLYPARSDRLGLRWAEAAYATLAGATPARAGFTAMTPTSTQSQCAVFETTFDHPETELLLAETASFGVPRGIAAWRRPPAGGTRRVDGGHFAFVSGRPYRWEHGALRANVRTILEQLFGEPTSTTGTPPPALVTHLHAPAPNPFNPGVQLRFDVGRAGRVVLRVFDARGHRLRTLLDAQRPAGPGSVAWDGRDADGRDVASGVYVVRLDTPDGTRRVKATLVR